MISVEESIPSRNLNYRIAEDIFYLQFNEVSFYIEDEEQENFFFCILKKLFPDIEISKIFPLNGKQNVIDECKRNIGDKRKVFIVDKDFDDILDKIEDIDNLFYLQRYSIENYLIEKDSIIEYIIGEKPKLQRNCINNSFDMDDCLQKIVNSLKELIYLYLVVQDNCPEQKNVSLNHQRFVSYDRGNFTKERDQFDLYKNLIETQLKSIDKRFTLRGRLGKVNKKVKLDTMEMCIKHIPGKYLVKMLKQHIESLFGLVSRNVDSYCYRISENCSFRSLTHLKTEINEYIR